MDDIMQVLQSFKQALDYLNEQNRHLDEKIDALESVLYDEILSPVQDTLGYLDNEERFGQFQDKYGERLSPLASEYAALYEGNDVTRDIFDTYKEHEGEFEEDAFVEEAIASIGEAITAAKEALGIPPEQPVTVTETEPTPENPEGIEVEPVGDVDNPDEVAAYEAELEKELKGE